VRVDPDRTDRVAGGPIVLVVPTAPRPDGNGLAMRAGMWLDMLAAVAPVHLVVVPVSGPADGSAWIDARAASSTVVDPVGADAADRHVVAQLGRREWRDAIDATAPLPWRVALAPPSLTVDAISQLAPHLMGTPPFAVVVLREYLVPFGVTLGRALDAVRMVVDLDDDVEPLLERHGNGAEAEAYGRVARHWLPQVDAITIASSAEALAVAARHQLAPLVVIPNTVAPVATVAPRPGHDRLLFVANLTYAPNEQAAVTLAREVLPIVRAARPTATLDLVGTPSAAVRALDEVPGVVVHGFVPSVAPRYAAADVMVAPLDDGAGTRIKVLEAFAHQRPVVATPAAVAGLAVMDGRDVLLARTPEALALAVERVLADPALADALVAAAAATLAEHYAPGVVAPIVRRVLVGDEMPGDEMRNHEMPNHEMPSDGMPTHGTEVR
jgi:glycosyltransferase involved in cell wall biosynthesis